MESFRKMKITNKQLIEQWEKGIEIGKAQAIEKVLEIIKKERLRWNYRLEMNVNIVYEALDNIEQALNTNQSPNKSEITTSAVRRNKQVQTGSDTISIKKILEILEYKLCMQPKLLKEIKEAINQEKLNVDRSNI